MQLRTAFTITLALLGAAAAFSACESEPQVCAPKIESGPPAEDPNPQCSACIEAECSDVGESCASECKAYGDCTCDCPEDDVACFQTCLDDKSEDCNACEQRNADAVVACLMSECQECFGGDGNGNEPSVSDSGAPSSTDTGGGGGGAACEQLHACCPNLEALDRDLCEATSDEGSCQFWLDLFQEEGQC